MDDRDAQRRINQMVEFMKLEAKEKAAEIQTKVSLVSSSFSPPNNQRLITHLVSSF